MKFPNPVRVFWVDETAWATGAVRGWGSGNTCEGKYCCTTGEQYVDHGLKPWREPDLAAVEGRLKPTCNRCGKVIPEISWHASVETLYRLPAVKTWAEWYPAGHMVPLELVPVGAMWDAHWLAGARGEDRGYTGPDGISLCVKLPNGHHWQVDSQASNCTRPQHQPVEPAGDGESRTMRFVRSHYCWVRSGNPREGVCDVGKDGNTCAAGAGSIWVDRGGLKDWHGFLHGSMLTVC